MKFISLSTPRSILSDGQLSCQYQDIPDLFAKLHQLFDERDISQQDGIVLECENSLPCAIVLLFLLEHDYHILLIKPENSEQIPPTFCRYQLRIKANSIEPREFLAFTKHPTHTLMPTGGEAKLLLRTSGSTGEPKIIVHTHARLHGNISMCVQRLGLSSQSRIALPVPISHLFGLGTGFLPAITVGASVDLQKGANIIRFLQREQDFNPNTAYMTPIFCETLLKGRKVPRSYQLTVVAGDRLRDGVFNRYEAMFGCLVQLYGSTEMGAIAVGNPQDSSELRAEAIGLPMPDVHIKVDKTTAEVIDNSHDSGEIWCKRQYCFVECWDNQGHPVELAQCNADGWFGTRDLGRILPNGSIEVLGRCDHSIKRDGLLVMFSEVEAAIQIIQGIESVAVVARGESLRGKGLWAYCVVSGDSQLDSSAIRSCCFDLLPKRAIPDQVIIVDALPQLANGKIDRRSLLTV